MKGVVNNLDG